ncbi:MAG: alpha-amylase family glycosyl hydrolase, partial [Limnochordia bacterium]
MQAVQLSFSSPGFAEKYHYNGDDLGVTYRPEGCSFRVWAPTAENVILITYPTGHDSAGEYHPMQKSDLGTWHLELPGDLHGTYYNYLVTIDGISAEAVDPYAKACGVNGMRGMVVDLERTNPEGWHQLKTPPLVHFTDAIIYELHIRDFTIDQNSGVTNKGKYLGLTEHGTYSPQKLATGLYHLKELGVTHVQLMPVFDFFTVDESKSANPEYNWGYDPQNFNVPEGSYSTDPYNGAVRIRELKQMIKALKEQGLRVIMDVVYNHTYLSRDSHLNIIVPGYYYRQDAHGNFHNGSGCGNELATERFMVRKLIVDSVCYWAREYKI